MNSPIFVALAGTPIIRAASRLPPTAKIQFPTRVRIRTHVPMAAITRNHRIATLNVALPIVNSVPAKILRAASEPGVDSTPVTLVRPVTRCVSHRLNPRRMKNVPSVTMKLGRPDLITM